MSVSVILMMLQLTHRCKIRDEEQQIETIRESCNLRIGVKYENKNHIKDIWQKVATYA